MTKRTVIIGVGGPVGSGKTLLLERLTRRMSDLNLAVILTISIQKKMAFSWLKIQAQTKTVSLVWKPAAVLILRFVRMPL